MTHLGAGSMAVIQVVRARAFQAVCHGSLGGKQRKTEVQMGWMFGRHQTALRFYVSQAAVKLLLAKKPGDDTLNRQMVKHPSARDPLQKGVPPASHAVINLKRVVSGTLSRTLRRALVPYADLVLVKGEGCGLSENSGGFF